MLKDFQGRRVFLHLLMLKLPIFTRKSRLKITIKLGKVNPVLSVALFLNIFLKRIWKPSGNFPLDVFLYLPSSDYQDQSPLCKHRSPFIEGKIPTNQVEFRGREILKSSTDDQTFYSAFWVLSGAEESILLVGFVFGAFASIRLSFRGNIRVFVVVSFVSGRSSCFSLTEC